MNNQNLQYQVDQSMWGANQNHSSNQIPLDQYQLAIYHDQQSTSNQMLPSSHQSTQAIMPQEFVNFSDLKIDSFEIIYPNHQVKSNMESCISQEKVLFVNSIEARREGQRKIRFGFKLSDLDLEKLESKGLKDSLHLGIYFSMPGVHHEIGPCKNHAEKFNTNEFCQLWFKNQTTNTKISIPNVSSHVTTIPIDLKENNDPFSLHFRFHCYTSCLSKIGDSRSLKLHYLLLFKPSVSTQSQILNSQLILSPIINQPIRITANPGRDAKVYTGAISRKRPRSESGAFEKQNIKRERNSIDEQELSYTLLQAIPQHEAKRIQKLFESIPPEQRNAIAQRESIRLVHNLELALLPATSPLAAASTYQSD